MSPTVVAQTTLMLAASNLFMLLAWYGHLKHFLGRPGYVVAFMPGASRSSST